MSGKSGSEASGALSRALELAASADPTPRFRIGTVAKLTGISPHQLRVWERRYQAFEPGRSAGGGRLYSQADVDRLRMIRELTQYGHSIGQIAHLAPNELQVLLDGSRRSAPVRGGAAASEQVRAAFLTALRELRTNEGERLLAQSSLAFEPRAFVIDVLVPLLREVGALWERGEFTVAQEHAATEVMRNQLGFLMRTYAQPADAPISVAATPTGELHALGALSAALVAAANGQRILYLGANVPAQDLVEAALSTKARNLLLSLVCFPEDPTPYLRLVREKLPKEVRMVIGGAKAAGVLVEGVERLASLEALDAWFRGSVW